MTELATIQTEEEFKPARKLELVETVEDPSLLRPGEEDSRFQDTDEAHETARLVDVQRDMLNEARADLEKAYATPNSPLVDKLERRVQNSELSLNAQLSEKPRHNPKPKADEYDIAA